MFGTTSTSSGTMSAGKFRAIQGITLMVAAVWTVLTLGLDRTLGLAAWNQCGALNYATAAGQITLSELEEEDCGDSRSFHPKLAYRYTVAGRECTADRYDYDPTWWTDAHAHRIVAEHPRGKQVDVRYDPRNPADAVLHAGVDQRDLFKFVFLVPMNLVMLALWSGTAAALYRCLAKPPAGGAKTWTDGGRTYMRLPGWHPLAAAAAVAVGLNVAGLVVFGMSIVESTPTALFVLFGAMLIAAAGIYLYLDGPLARGDCDLVIDSVAGTVCLPRSMGRKSKSEVPMDCIAAVELDQIESRDSDGQASYRFTPVLILDDGMGTQRPEKIVEWLDMFAAADLADWLRAQLCGKREAVVTS